jgi:hypothetical protein
MRLWLGLWVIGCADKAQQPCIEGTHRDGTDRCIPDEAEDMPFTVAVSMDDTGPTSADDTGPVGGDDPADGPDADGGDTDADGGDTDPPDDLTPTPSWMSLADATVVISGGATGARVGRAVAGAGDIDGDGRADIMVGADRANGVGGVEYGGWVTLHLASSLPATGSHAVESHSSRWLGFSEGELVGHNLGSGGDIDGDGQVDLLIAGYHAPAGGNMRGSVYGISGTSVVPGTHSTATADWTIHGSRNVEGVGHGMSTAGDVDGDGLADLVMGGCCGEPPGIGRAWVVTGAALTSSAGPIDLASHTPRWDGEFDNDQAGYKTSPLGDVDGDGLDDVAIGARLYSAIEGSAGKAYIIYGASIPGVGIGHLADADVHLPGTGVGGEHGYDIGPCGDMDGDGLNEIIVGAHHSSRNELVAGEAMLYYGSQLSTRSEILDTEADLRFISTEINHLLGLSVEGGMDFDGTGSLDLIIGAAGMAPPTQGEPGEHEGMDSPGDAYLYWGEDLTPGVHDVEEASVHFEGEELEDHAGIRVTSAGDVNADGADDLLIGTERGQTGVGQAYLIMGLRAPLP